MSDCETVMKSYKWCCVPLCSNTTKNTPNKIFVHVPKCAEKRKLWCEAARRTLPKPSSNLFCCEDHFNLEEDMANYMYYKEMGGRIFMKPSVVPHKFHCQPSWRRSAKQAAEAADNPKIQQLSRILTAMEDSPSTSQILVSMEQQPTSTTPSLTMIQSQPHTSSCLTTIKQEPSTTVTSANSESHPPIFPNLTRLQKQSVEPVSSFTAKRKMTSNVGLQVNIKTKYRSKGTYCNLDAPKQTRDACLSPITVPIMVNRALSPFKIPEEPTFSDKSNYAPTSTESYPRPKRRCRK